MVANVTGWNELLSGHMISAAYVMYDEALIGFVIILLYILFQVMLYLKTKSWNLGFVMGLFFMSMYIGATSITGVPLLKASVVPWAFLLLVLQLAAVIVFGILSTRKY